MILVADAAPLIFLAKINQLPLLAKLFDAEILVSKVVSNEIMSSEAFPDEERLLTDFLANCKIMTLRRPIRFAKALSFADNSILTLAVRAKADMVLSDDRLLRKTAVVESFRVIGTIGVLIRATKASLLTGEKTVELLEALIEEHHFRISTHVYEVTRNAIFKISRLS